MKRSHGRIAVVLLVLVLLLGCMAAAGGYWWVRHEFLAPGPSRAISRVVVEQGSSVRNVVAELAHEGALRNPRAVELYLRLSGRITGRQLRIQAGEYEIPAGASPAQILELFDQGHVVLEQLTVVEGSTFAEFRRSLEHHAAVTHSLAGKSDAELMAALGHPDQRPEGLFFPDTYRFAARTGETEILQMAYAAMQRVLQAAWEGRSADLPLQNPYEALILASIVEKETGFPDERSRIAGVFVTRLRKGMRLQTDPTVIYGLGASYDGQIRTRDLVTDTPYNTYTRAGLPPTPIALPGRDAIMAAVQPQETGELYFVATGNGDGRHHFSRTLEEHNAAVKSYLEHLRSQQRAARGAAAGGSRTAAGAQTQSAPRVETATGTHGSEPDTGTRDAEHNTNARGAH